MSVSFPKDFLEIDIEIPTLALVVEDVCPDTRKPNTSEPIHLICCSVFGLILYVFKIPNSLPGPNCTIGYTWAEREIEQRWQSMLITLLCKTTTVNPTSHIVVLEGEAKAHHPLADKSSIINHPTQSSLPGGLCCLITLLTHAPFKVPLNQSRALPIYLLVSL